MTRDVLILEKEGVTAAIVAGKVFVTRGMINLLSHDELGAVIEHEYAHKKLRHTLRFIVIEVMLLSLFITTSYIHPVTIPATFIICTMTLAFISHMHELEADKVAFKTYGQTFIDAIKKLNHPSGSFLSTHPSLEARIRALQI